MDVYKDCHSTTQLTTAHLLIVLENYLDEVYKYEVSYNLDTCCIMYMELN